MQPKQLASRLLIPQPYSATTTGSSTATGAPKPAVSSSILCAFSAKGREAFARELYSHSQEEYSEPCQIAAPGSSVGTESTTLESPSQTEHCGIEDDTAPACFGDGGLLVDDQTDRVMDRFVDWSAGKDDTGTEESEGESASSVLSYQLGSGET